MTRGVISSSMAVFAALTLILCGCGGAGGGRGEAVARPDQLAKNPTLELLRAAGSEATATVLLHPGRWGAAARTLTPLVQDLRSATLNQALAQVDIWSALRVVLEAEQRDLELPPRLEGWDPSRPLVLALGLPRVGEAVVAARAMAPLGDAEGPIGIRHRLLVPATAPGRLAAVITELLRRTRLVRSSHGVTLAPGKAPVKIFRLRTMRGLLAVVPEQDRVRLEVLTAGRRGMKAVEQGSHPWLKMLAAPPASEPLPLTPALHRAALGEGIAAVHLRLWQLRALGSQMGTLQVQRALAHADPSMQAMLLARGLSEVARGYLLMSPRGAEADDLTLALTLDGAVRAEAVTSLTEQGAKVLEAGMRGRAALPAPKSERALLSARLHLDLEAMLQAAELPRALGRARNLRQVARAVRECGWACSAYFALRQPVGLSRALRRGISEVLPPLPAAVSLVVRSLELGRRGWPEINGALAALVPAGSSTVSLRRAMARLNRRSGGATSAQLYSERRGERELLQLGLGLDPRGVFGGAAAPPAAGVIAEATLLPAALANLVTGEAPELASALDKLAAIRLRSRRSGRALVSELTLETRADGAAPKKGSQKAPPADELRYQGFAWASPGLKQALTPGARCLEQVTETMVEAFSALASADPARRGDLLRAAAEMAEKPLACALNSAATRARAQQLQRAMTMIKADTYAAQWRDAEQARVLAEACQQGYQPACSRAEALAKQPAVALPRVDGSCAAESVGGARALLVPVKGEASLGQRPVSFFAGASGGGRGAALLAADEGTTVKQVVAAVQKNLAKERRLKLVLRRASSGLAGAVSLRAVHDQGQRSRTAAWAVRVGPSSVVILSDEAPKEFPHTQSCGRGPSPCVDRAALKGALEAGDRAGKRSRSYRRAAPMVALAGLAETPWHLLAGAASAVHCHQQDRHRISHRSPSLELYLWPAAAPKPDERLPRAKGAVSRLSGKRGGILKLLGTRGSKAGISNVFGRGTAIKGLGGLKGVGLARGVGGLGLRGSGKGGGTIGKGFGRVGVKNSGARSRATASPGRPAVTGKLDRIIVRRVIRRHTNAMRYCYQRALQRSPRLAGKVVVQFTIGGNGRVTQTRIKSTTIKNSSVESCLVRHFKRMRFPAPKGGGVVVVSYPVVFRTR